jgi:hypothetical protein
LKIKKSITSIYIDAYMNSEDEHPTWCIDLYGRIGHNHDVKDGEGGWQFTQMDEPGKCSNCSTKIPESVYNMLLLHQLDGDGCGKLIENDIII